MSHTLTGAVGGAKGIATPAGGRQTGDAARYGVDGTRVAVQWTDCVTHALLAAFICTGSRLQLTQKIKNTYNRKLQYS
jgi:hypothetical protein